MVTVITVGYVVSTRLIYVMTTCLIVGGYVYTCLVLFAVREY